MTTLLYSYNPHSRSGRQLSEGLGIRRIRHRRSRYRPKEDDTVINWGATSLPFLDNPNAPLVINTPISVSTVSNKLSFFNHIGENPNVPPYTVDLEQARLWCREGHAVVCRTVLRGHSGAGIVVALTEDQLVAAPLYTKYLKKKDEYRVHIAEGEIFDIQKKAKILEREDVNWYVRNYHNGFIYRRNDIEPPEEVRTVALDIFQRTSLDFGAVDVIWNNRQHRAYVLEINTAPGITGTTLENYIETFRRWV